MVKKILPGFFIGGAISALLLFGLSLNFFKTWQLKLSDTLFEPRPPHGDIVIIGIDNASIGSIGRWPWDRSVHAQLLEILSAANPASVGLDISFFEPSNPTSDQQLAQSIAKLDAVTLAAEIEEDHVLKPLEQFARNAKYGVVNISLDSDGIARRAPIFLPAGLFAIEVLQRYLETSKPQRNPLENGIPLDQGLLLINFIGRPQTFPYYSYIDVLEEKVNLETFTNKIVLIGATAPDLHDDQNTPVSFGRPMPAVEIHANIIQTILEEKYLINERRWVTQVTVVATALLLSLLYIGVGITPMILIFIFALVTYLLYAMFSFDQGIIRNVIYPPLAIITSTMASIGYKYLAEYRQKQFIKRVLSYYLSQSVLKEVLADPAKLKLGGERREVTVLFSDVAGFTTIAEALPAETLPTMLNQYLSRMTRIIFHYDGVLDKYIGDAVMAFWGAPVPNPHHPLAACQAAWDMYQETLAFRAELRRFVPRAYLIPEVARFDIRIGVSTGETVVGNMGSDQRFDYTLLGDNVNLASRLEGINKQYGTRILVSEATFAQVKDKVITRRLDKVAVKGKRKGVNIYELRGLGKPDAREQKFIQDFEKAQAGYTKGDFKQALELFKKCQRLNPADIACQVYISRCKELIKHKPQDWDGVYHAITK